MGKSEYLKNCSQSSELTFKRHLRQNTSVKPAVLQRDGQQRQETLLNTPKPDSLEYTASQQKQERHGSMRWEVKDMYTSVHRCKAN